MAILAVKVAAPCSKTTALYKTHSDENGVCCLVMFLQHFLVPSPYHDKGG